jgi:GntR family transcriptional regulator/MocR family aminotransferase
MASFPIQLDRARRTSLAAQIYSAIREGIENGRLASGAWLPSWQDLAAQLGVSRGTVLVAYARLIAEQFAIGLGPALNAISGGHVSLTNETSAPWSKPMCATR